ncbi:hypothetical protein MRB53_039930 [Persea americana]|nr:hypothetical protein MRB53_039930 [Persea americana]
MPHANDNVKAILPNHTTTKEIMPHGLTPKASERTLNAQEPLVQSADALSLLPEGDSDTEIITGPTQDDDDDLAAPAPSVKQGKQQDMVTRQRKRSSVQSLKSVIRGRSPDTRTINPIIRQQPESHTNLPSTINEQPTAQQDHQPHQLQREILPEDITEEEPIRKPKNVSPPASYRPTGLPAGQTSVHTSRSSSPIKSLPRQQSSSRISALNQLEGNGSMTSLSNSPPKRRTAGPRSRRTSMQSMSTLNQRQSQYSLSSMSNTMATLYGAHEKTFKDRQSVTQEDLIARGLDEMDFAALR